MHVAYLVSTDLFQRPNTPIVMVDGTLPGWSPRPQDIHLDHHQPGGADVQIAEIPEGLFPAADATFVATQIDADACAAAARIQLLTMSLRHNASPGSSSRCMSNRRFKRRTGRGWMPPQRVALDFSSRSSTWAQPERRLPDLLTFR